MAAKVSPTLRVLLDIRGELKDIRGELKDIRVEIKGTNTRVEAVEHGLETLSRRQTETEIRLASELVAVANAVSGLKDLLRERLDDRERVDDHERRISDLERREPREQ